jgi:Glycosyltransferase family 87
VDHARIAIFPDDSPWYTRYKVQAWAVWLLAGIAVVQGYISVFNRDNDFLWHREHGRLYLAGESGRDHYLPARFFMNIPLALFEYRATRAVVVALALVLLLISYRLWSAMAAQQTPASATAVRAAGIMTAFMLLPYILRDFDDCGLQIILLFLLSIGGWALSRGRTVQAGFWLATAACYKATPILFLPFLLWKRQWRAVGWMAVFFVLWCAVPSLQRGWDQNVLDHQNWWAEVVHLKSARQAYPSLLEREPPLITNMSLMAGIARYLETYPPGHTLYADHPWFVQFGNLSGPAAYNLLNGILAVMALAFAWKTWRAWDAPATGLAGGAGPGLGSAFTGEWAAVCTLCALLSPLCWMQHVVVALPCAFLVLRSIVTSQEPRRWRMAAIWTCGVLMCVFAVPNIGLDGEFTAMVISYKVHTLACVVLTCWALCMRPGAGMAAVRTLPEGSAVVSRAA